MLKLRRAVILFVSIIGLAGCETFDGDWDYTPITLPTYSAPSGDNRSHQQKLDDAAYWAEYHR